MFTFFSRLASRIWKFLMIELPLRRHTRLYWIVAGFLSFWFTIAFFMLLVFWIGEAPKFSNENSVWVNCPGEGSLYVLEIWIPKNAVSSCSSSQGIHSFEAQNNGVTLEVVLKRDQIEQKRPNIFYDQTEVGDRKIFVVEEHSSSFLVLVKMSVPLDLWWSQELPPFYQFAYTIKDGIILPFGFVVNYGLG